jgi:large subunit ribosomal protein L35
MPKLKTRKSVSKRVKITKKGKAKMQKAFKGHLLTTKNRKRKRHLRLKSTIYGKEARKLSGMMPY